MPRLPSSKTVMNFPTYLGRQLFSQKLAAVPPRESGNIFSLLYVSRTWALEGDQTIFLGSFCAIFLQTIHKEPHAKFQDIPCAVFVLIILYVARKSAPDFPRFFFSQCPRFGSIRSHMQNFENKNDQTVLATPPRITRNPANPHRLARPPAPPAWPRCVSFEPNSFRTQIVNGK